MDLQRTPRLAIVIDRSEAEQMRAACQRVGMFKEHLEVPDVPVPEEGKVVKLGPIRATKIAQSLSAEVMRLKASLDASQDLVSGPRPISSDPLARTKAKELLAPTIQRNRTDLEVTSKLLGELITHLDTAGQLDESLQLDVPHEN